MTVIKKRIAVIGAGISGLTAAWSISKTHNVTLFEEKGYLGGHANTVDVPGNSKTGIDTGFVVFNEQNYPSFTALLKLLDVQTQSTSMSFAVSLDNGSFEYSSSTILRSLFNLSNLNSKRFKDLVTGLVKLYGPSGLSESASMSEQPIGEFLRCQGFSESFIQDHVLPMTAAIWSSSIEDAARYPVGPFFAFFKNHRLLSLFQRLSWKTISGGSRNYIQNIENDGDFETKLNCKVVRVERSDRIIRTFFKNGLSQEFDEVVFANHGDTVLKILNEPSREEREILGRFKYSKNIAVLHEDKTFMPTNRKLWSSWNYLRKNTSDVEKSPIFVTYWMNKLHQFEFKRQFFVTLNPVEKVSDRFAFYETEYSHPIINLESVQASSLSRKIQGRNRSWFCGAYLGAGFHEDGVQAGLWVANQLGSKKIDSIPTNYSRLPDTYWHSLEDE